MTHDAFHRYPKKCCGTISVTCGVKKEGIPTELKDLRVFQSYSEMDYAHWKRIPIWENVEYAEERH